MYDSDVKDLSPNETVFKTRWLKFNHKTNFHHLLIKLYQRSLLTSVHRLLHHSFQFRLLVQYGIRLVFNKKMEM
ncbi:Protein of unknown function [Pyronema omphalodes CBS 100304]|uniref:Uncharacterized protein n=1 Tax=Pyronema omphalodes (strain CBS 100304) TaxID=1076935 RepID=U4L344_PYROM|nr:Protein of unknown function [Pyronema omphalodes CBS 100304]